MVASVVSASCVSCGDAEQRCFPKGRPWPSTTTIHFVPLPRLVFPTPAPIFWRKQSPDLLPLCVGQQTTVSRHRPSSGAADLVYLAFPSTQLPQNSGLAPSFETASSF